MLELRGLLPAGPDESLPLTNTISLYSLGEGVQPGNLNFQSKAEGYKTRCLGIFFV